MPLLHQDNNRGGGGSREHRRSMAEFVGFNTSEFAKSNQIGEAATPNTARTTEEGGGNEWRWDTPSSPEAAETPGSLVPSPCFPSRHPTANASYSESARQGGWDNSGQGITELVASLKALAMPPAYNSRDGVNQTRFNCDALAAEESPWPPEGARAHNNRGKHNRTLPRRASFCGAVSSRNSDALRWKGTLPWRCLDPSCGFSPKVFLGGLPWDLSEQALINALKHFQPVKVEWPTRSSGASPRGYVYVTLESERRVRALLAASRKDGSDWYYRLATRNMRRKEVQVIPWAVSDSNWVAPSTPEAPAGTSVRLEPARTVFVGALHGMLSASALANIMNDLFCGVVYAGIDTDKNKYPIGSGRVTFNNAHSYVRAISAAYIEICTDKFIKKVQVDPYLEDSMCSMCNLQQGPYFCRQPGCFSYFCRSCWALKHSNEKHNPLMRNSKSALRAPDNALRAPDNALRAPDNALRAPDNGPALPHNGGDVPPTSPAPPGNGGVEGDFDWY